MKHVGQHYVHGTPLAVAATACDPSGDVVRAFVSTRGHGDNARLFQLRDTGNTGKDTFRFESQSLVLPNSLTAVTFVANDAVVGASHDTLLVLSNLASKAIGRAALHVTDGVPISALASAGECVAFATVDGSIGLFDSAAQTLLQAPTEVAGLGGLEVSALTSIGSTELLGVCRNVAFHVDTRRPSSVVNSWRWNPADLITSVAASNTNVICGTEEGKVVLFDWRLPEPTGYAVADAASPVVGVAAVDDACFVSASSNGSSRLWASEVVDRAASLYGPRFYPPAATWEPSMGSTGAIVATSYVPGVGLWMMCDDSGMIDVFVL
jgi:hypothetical protein